MDTNPGLELKFSEDTVYFDTVFTSMGSVTQYFKVYNKNEKTVNISDIRLAGGSSSSFRLNIDGKPGNQATNIEIEGNDSIFVFVEVNIDPNNENNPFVMLDSVFFQLNGNMQNVKLMAYGRNAKIYRPKFFPNNGFPSYSFVECDAHWTSEKPVVIIGYLAVDSACKLTIDQGTQIYLYNNSGIWVYKNGTIEVNGTRGSNVVFQGVRKEKSYQNIPGQWDRIWINQGNTTNRINYAVIKNGNIGIQAEFLPELGDGPLGGELELTNTIIMNMKAFGLYGVNYKITKCWNNIVSNCGSYCLALLGGKYDFRHCSVANYWVGNTRTEPSVYISNGKQNANQSITAYDLDFQFSNGIIYGNKSDENEIELGRVSNPAVGFNWKFQNSILKIKNKDIDINNASNFTGMLFNKEPLFENPSEQNYKLKIASPARNAGNPNFASLYPELSEDLAGNNRLAGGKNPDLGALEYTP